ncbi:cofactor assembly of complex C subunit B [Gloeobacter violaceus]|uniref:Gll4313 protein n=1 Tax=Gloeobacter violaceus (strain ATCC 29082 / PCC 7421) TaxID=251221 RepID=Q7NDC2_GLOVI|nr:cofactor assembly of complex C subunit B [Gloeobacter violaceus]BAC92254.1 gll4313 [Gloeobacter violaceus PCC 7421]
MSSVLLRNLPIAVGLLGGSLVVLNRLLGTANLAPEQTRSDALGLAMAAVLVLVGLFWQQVQPVPPEEVQLVGQPVDERSERLAYAEAALMLIRRLLLEHTRARVLLVWWQGETAMRAGVFEGPSPFKAGPIVERVLRTGQPVYLVDLRLFPGRIEFAYLPSNLQAVVCQPLGNRGVLLVGSAAPRSFSEQELAWIETLAQFLDERLRAAG